MNEVAKQRVNLIIEYIEQTAKGNNKCMKWNNIIVLLNMAVINKKITKDKCN